MLRKIIPDVIGDQVLAHLTETATVRDAARLMRERNVASVLVMKGPALLGIFTERDMVQRVVAEGCDPEETRLGQVMTPNPDTISADRKAIEALRLMDDAGYRHLPVVRDGEVVAVVSRRDFSGAEKARLDDETAVWDRIG
jgi:CBS domain-containing protein